MNRKVILVLIAAAAPALYAQQITRIAVLDYSRILSAFYADSAESRRIEEMKTAFAEEVRALQAEIQDLEERKLAASNRGDSRSELDLDEQIQDRKRYFREYVRIKGNQIRLAEANLSSSGALAAEILNEIQYVAEANGFSVVLKRSDTDILWWSYEVDITDMVLQRLMNSD